MQKYIYIRGFTLIETIIIVVILGILAGISVPVYHKTVRSFQDKEARAVLRTIWAAQKVYHQEHGYYYPPPPDTSETDINVINAGLHLNLSPDRNVAHPDETWDYEIQKLGGGFAIKAIHKSSGTIIIDHTGNFSES